MKMNIKSCDDLQLALDNTRNDPKVVKLFVKRFKEASVCKSFTHREASYLRCAAMYMNSRWDYDHEYFQRMIDRDVRMNAEMVGCIITGMSQLNNESSSDDDSMPGLQERTREDSSSDTTTDSDTDSYGDDVMYDDGESWGYKAFTLKQIIGGTHEEISLGNYPNLYTFSLHGYNKVETAASINKEIICGEVLNFRPAKE